MSRDNYPHRYQDLANKDIAEPLTNRENEILSLLAERLTDREIAQELLIGIGTVKWYNLQIYSKLGVNGRRQAVARATELGLLCGPEENLRFTARNPYKGLQSFEEVDAGDFFGRQALTKRLVTRLCENGPFSKFLAIVGPSGSGKSSVVKAGLIPALRQNAIPGSKDWTIISFIPGPHPFDELEVALVRAAGDPSLTLMEHLRRDERGLLRSARLIFPDDNHEILLVIDQFEETFTQVQDTRETHLLLESLTSAVTAPRSPIRVVITLRADFYDRPLLVSGFSDLVQERTEVVIPMGPQEIEEAITGPALRVGADIPSSLLAALVSDVSDQPGTLPMLQYTLTELFDRRKGRSLTMDAYKQLGGVQGILARRAEAIYTGLDSDEQFAAQQVFLRLVTLGEGTADIRRRVTRSELVSAVGDPVNGVLDVFDWSRLLAFDHDPAMGDAAVELTHEAIITEWPRLRMWLDENRNDVRQQRLLSHAVQEWKNAGRDNSYLLQGSRLQQYADWSSETQLALTGEERIFLDNSIAEEKRRQTRRRRIRNIVLILVVTVAVIMAILALWANSERQKAEIAEHEARRQASIGLASIALQEMESGRQDQAVLLALEALNEYPYTSQAESALAEIVEAYVPYIEITRNEVRTYAWSPNGERIALGGSEAFGTDILNDGIQITKVDDISSDKVQVALSLEVPGCTPREMVWSPDGERLISIYMRGEYSTDPCHAPPTIWDASSGEVVLQFTGHGEDTNVLSVDWSPDGTSILTTGEDGIAKVWDAQTGTELLTIADHTAAITDGAWSPTGDQFATTSLDASVRVWNTANGDELLNISGYIGGMTGLDWSPDGSRLVVASIDGIARIFDVESKELLLNLTGHGGTLVGVKYSPEGDRIATASNVDGTARIWDAETGEVSLTFQGLGVEVRDVVWSTDGKSFTVNGPRHYIVWDVSNKPLNLSGHTARIQDGEWSPDGKLIATGSFDNTARIWDAETGEELYVLDHGNQVWHLDWSPDSTQIVTAGSGGAAYVWDVATGDLVKKAQLSPEDAILFSARWSPDGSRIVNGDLTSHDTVWNPYTDEVVAILDYKTASALLGPNGFCILFGPSWSPDSSRIAIGCPTGMAAPGTGPLIFDAATGELIMSFDAIHNGASRTDWSSDGSRIASASGSTANSDGMITVWDAATGELLLTFAGHNVYSYGLSWSPDGSRIATGDLDGIVKVWDPDTGEEVLGFRVPGLVINVHWHPDGTHLIVTGEFTPPIIRRVWPSTQALIDYAYECCVTRDLTEEDREHFGLSVSDS